MLVVPTGIADPGQWEFTGSLGTARHLHTATLLPNGKVLVVGGLTSTAILGSAELYDPAGGTWSPTGNLNISRAFHTATLLSNGMVLVAGGSHDFDPSPSAEIYDPVTGTWSVTGDLKVVRQQHTAILLPDGKVLIAGGVGRDKIHGLQSAEIYDSATGNWTNTGSTASAHGPGTAPVPLTLLPNGDVLLEGGLDEHFESSADAELYDPESGTWRLTDSLTTAREGHTATLLPNGKVLVASGLNRDLGDLPSAELYDPASETWSVTGSLIEAREHHTATLLTNGMVLVAAGYSFPSGSTADAELYDPATGIWSATGSLNIARTDHTATLLPNGMVLVAAGFGDAGILDSAELYDPGIVVATTVKGRGAINGQGGQATFNFHVMQRDDRPTGSFSFRDPGAGVSIPKAKVRSLTITGNSADFRGSGRLEDGTRVRFKVSVTDNGSPGTSDTISITLSNGYTVSGTLISGDIRIF